jgi:hypothetical protein
MSKNTAPLPPAMLANIEATIADVKAVIESHEKILDDHWAALRVLAEIKQSGRMSIAQRGQLAAWLQRA